MLPFFFLFYLPKGKTRGIAIFQRFGTFGVRSSYISHFQEHFLEKAPEYAIRVEPVIHPKLLEQLLSGGTIKKIRFRQMKLPSDISQQYHFGKEAAEQAYVEYAIIAKKKGSLPFAGLLAKLALNRKSTAGLIDDPPHFASDRVLLDVSANGKTRLIDISDLARIRSYYDITNEVKMESSGHPKLSSILDISKGLTKEIWDNLEGSTDE